MCFIVSFVVIEYKFVGKAQDSVRSSLQYNVRLFVCLSPEKYFNDIFEMINTNLL